MQTIITIICICTCIVVVVILTSTNTKVYDLTVEGKTYHNVTRIDSGWGWTKWRLEDGTILYLGNQFYTLKEVTDR